ncbi:MAG: hypothetical protein ABWY54_00235 [Glaciihabitans sp.]
MLLSNGAMNQAAGDIREIAQMMTTVMNELGTPSTWSGDDSEKFQRDWNDLVHARLVTAANKLDGIDFKELVAGFDG